MDLGTTTKRICDDVYGEFLTGLAQSPEVDAVRLAHDVAEKAGDGKLAALAFGLDAAVGRPNWCRVGSGMTRFMANAIINHFIDDARAQGGFVQALAQWHFGNTFRGRGAKEEAALDRLKAKTSIAPSMFAPLVEALSAPEPEPEPEPFSPAETPAPEPSPVMVPDDADAEPEASTDDEEPSRD